jgi:hypothetical protein
MFKKINKNIAVSNTCSAASFTEAGGAEGTVLLNKWNCSY